MVRVSDLYGYIDQSGKIVVDPQYASANSYSQGLAVIRTGRGYGYLDRAGQLATDPEFTLADDFRKGWLP
ncbi:MAG: WG repeat-containing protein [Leptolyngbyaceae cyanobacterium SM1_3_5]|nr:WG repeat-containing protein [Leptolyngbyaceae cyanobacterium SM1_3_5]